ncbi:gamma-glutamyl-gamma-aminobutyrate hydrolase [Tistlia consotensis]|uniref:gamma-glutamyl-gamma-aminobutyrate hydrolase n=1 Tax=Tistlia consotensis USBA 355 TaxID=560819 RepID=A0A1Y6BLY3_9PROT|nr:gamma-glutamyl-gamma-aminobutyrate hydrolase family protein [Tistlia consotensis]SMF09422.1 gamma-glutamyl-gamma-aminobutyrate hydrolase [Tistlia consotensis USBA 355]SNR34548.1 gamma-glutamyl-gamma-aminobutyrate hydrolase [Tistlia consotensis]
MSPNAHFSGPRPLIGLPACVKPQGGQDYHTIGDKYVRAVATASEGIPLVVPALGALVDPRALVERLDGLVLTGSPSNVHPSRYGHAPTPEHEPHDEARDATTLPLIEAALEAGLPLFAICRGHQELNVALGGTLHARVHEIEGRQDHRRPQHDELDVQYGKRHAVKLDPSGRLAAIAGSDEIRVNSLHWQAIDGLAPGLSVEGRAPDGTIEAVSVTGATAFTLGVQWHPEYKVLEDPVSTAIFRAFGAAARERMGRYARAAE